MEAQFHQSELVKFRLGTRSIHGEIKEDRGPIGIKGRHLYLAEFRPERQSVSLSEIELPADELQPVQRASLTE
jgi:hypothetical protein